MGCRPAGDRSMIASRRWPRPTGPSMNWPSPSGPRCATASVMRRRMTGETGSPSKCRIPVMPHMAVDTLLGGQACRPAAGGELRLVRSAPLDHPLQPFGEVDLRLEADLGPGAFRIADAVA